ncbi:Inorganic phosphate cotransporter-like protein [Daphnia magna]|uniref:Inorganic phosphate cotransporter-like protein n=1 Tax=Daphnia magna TaxID=35525 RepID=A0A164SF50_9CRUS|nr:Inorganic phosphate cotransporter-like protein [Daphnia magna]
MPCTLIACLALHVPYRSTSRPPPHGAKLGFRKRVEKEGAARLPNLQHYQPLTTRNREFINYLLLLIRNVLYAPERHINITETEECMHPVGPDTASDGSQQRRLTWVLFAQGFNQILISLLTYSQKGGVERNKENFKNLLEANNNYSPDSDFLAAYISYIVVLVVRFVEGLGAGVSLPAFHIMLTKWVLLQERNLRSSLAYAGMALGTVISLPFSSILFAALGWEAVFYVQGSLSMIWCVSWLIFVFDSPEDHPRIHPVELELFETSMHHDDHESHEASKEAAQLEDHNITEGSFVVMTTVIPDKRNAQKRRNSQQGYHWHGQQHYSPSSSDVRRKKTLVGKRQCRRRINISVAKFNRKDYLKNLFGDEDELHSAVPSLSITTNQSNVESFLYRTSGATPNDEEDMAVLREANEIQVCIDRDDENLPTETNNCLEGILLVSPLHNQCGVIYGTDDDDEIQQLVLDSRKFHAKKTNRWRVKI